jgi:hypothetical protein
MNVRSKLFGTGSEKSLTKMIGAMLIVALIAIVVFSWTPKSPIDQEQYMTQEELAMSRISSFVFLFVMAIALFYGGRLWQLWIDLGVWEKPMEE